MLFIFLWSCLYLKAGDPAPVELLFDVCNLSTSLPKSPFCDKLSYLSFKGTLALSNNIEEVVGLLLLQVVLLQVLCHMALYRVLGEVPVVFSSSLLQGVVAFYYVAGEGSCLLAGEAGILIYQVFDLADLGFLIGYTYFTVIIITW